MSLSRCEEMGSHGSVNRPKFCSTGQAQGGLGPPGGLGQRYTCHVELCEGVTSGRPDSGEQVGGLICQVAAVTEVQSRQEGHVANDEAKRGICDVKACQPEVGHIPELAAIVLTCTRVQSLDRNL